MKEIEIPLKAPTFSNGKLCFSAIGVRKKLPYFLVSLILLLLYVFSFGSVNGFIHGILSQKNIIIMVIMASCTVFLLSAVIKLLLGCLQRWDIVIPKDDNVAIVQRSFAGTFTSSPKRGNLHITSVRSPSLKRKFAILKSETILRERFCFLIRVTSKISDLRFILPISTDEKEFLEVKKKIEDFIGNKIECSSERDDWPRYFWP